MQTDMRLICIAGVRLSAKSSGGGCIYLAKMNLDEVEKQYAQNLSDLKWRNVHQWKPLLEEIHKLKKTLLKLDTCDTDPTDHFSEHAQWIQNSIPPIPTKQIVVPIHQLLKVGPLKRIEVPLDVLEILTSAGFDVNYRRDGETCLHVAVGNRHYKVVRWLVEHGADCEDNNIFDTSSISPIAFLTRYPDVPLDLLDLLKTPTNLNAADYPPLHEALRHRHTDYALRLIQLGAKLDVKDAHHKIPLDIYVDAYLDEFCEELFMNLIPHHSMPLLSVVRKILQDRSYMFEMSQMVRYLLQHLIVTDLHAIPVGKKPMFYNKTDPKVVYIDNLIVLLLDINKVKKPAIAGVKPVPQETCKQAIEDIWHAYNHRHGNVKSLVTLCIHSVRNSMNSLHENSFYSLPGTSHTRDLLMLRNVAGILCEAWRIWPQYLPLEDIVNEAL